MLYMQLLMFGYVVLFGKLLAEDVCPWENFSPNCPTGEVLIIQSAVYGMMREGRCVEEDFGYLGCSSDQLWYFDQQCSGRRSCDVITGTSNKELKDRLTILCPVPYLEVEYTCQKVVSPTSSQCNGAHRIDVKPSPGHLASYTSAQTSCGHGNSPWVLSALPGQTIYLTLIDFSWDEHYVTGECPRVYGLILSYTSDDMVQICGGKKRTQQLKHSSSHQIQIVLEEAAVTSYHFLIKYEALGCPEVVPPRNAWVRKVGNDVTVGCHASTDTWQLRCIGSHWIGVTGNCSAATVSTPLKVQPIEKEDFNNFHVSAFAIGCLAIIICCVTVTLGVYCIKRHQVKAEFSYLKADTSTLYLAPKSNTPQWQNTGVIQRTASRGPRLTHGCFEETLPNTTNSETFLSSGQQVPLGGTVTRSTGNDVNLRAQALPSTAMQQDQVYAGSQNL